MPSSSEAATTVLPSSADGRRPRFVTIPIHVPYDPNCSDIPSKPLTVEDFSTFQVLICTHIGGASGLVRDILFFVHIVER
jgi:hypothetical protein